jgi:hypothetical protein
MMPEMSGVWAVNVVNLKGAAEPEKLRTAGYMRHGKIDGIR